MCSGLPPGALSIALPLHRQVLQRRQLCGRAFLYPVIDWCLLRGRHLLDHLRAIVGCCTLLQDPLLQSIWKQGWDTRPSTCVSINPVGATCSRSLAQESAPGCGNNKYCTWQCITNHLNVSIYGEGSNCL